MIFSDQRQPALAAAGSGRLSGTGWGVSLVVLAVWCVILFIFRQQVAMVLVAWETLPSHAHGYVVLVIVAYLLWCKRPLMLGLACEPSLKGFLALALTGLMAIVGEMVSVAAVVQFSIILMMLSAVWAVAGDRALRTTIGPLSFLLFAVPFGMGILPVLMTWTADATVLALRLTGVPVYQEGRNFVIPSGRWSVVEACGGIRYLMTSIFIGAVFAYVTYTRLYKRVLFMVWAIIMPLIANWVRAYTIVMVAYLTENEWGLGLSHLALGWVIFGVAIFVSFAVGVRWHDSTPVVPPAKPGPIPLGKILIAGVLAAGVPAGLHLSAQALGSQVAIADPVLRLDALAGLERSYAAADGIRPSFPGARVTHQATYLYKGEPVDVFVAYFRNQTQGAELVNVVNALEPTKDWSWSISSQAGGGKSGLPSLDFEGYVKRDIHAAVYHFYWVNGMTTTSDIGSKLLEAVSRLRGRGDDAAAVAITAYSAESMEVASRKAEAFAADYLAGMLADLERTATSERK